jgi:hypothetical protein
MIEATAPLLVPRSSSLQTTSVPPHAGQGTSTSRGAVAKAGGEAAAAGSAGGAAAALVEGSGTAAAA